MTARRILLAAALAAGLAMQCGIVVTPARAERGDYRRGEWHQHHDRGRHRGWYRHHGRWEYYYAPPPVYYAPPTVYYAPPPVYIPPPPPPPSIGFNLIFPFRFH